MEPYKRYVPIDYAKFAPDLSEAELEARYGLPAHVQFCRECVMSNQKPNSCYEFEHTINSVKKSMHIGEDGVCDACHACRNKVGRIDWEDRERRLRELCDRYRRTDGSYDCLVPGSGGKDSFLRGAYAQIQVRHAPAHRHLGAAYLYALGVGELSGMDSRGL